MSSSNRIGLTTGAKKPEAKKADVKKADSVTLLVQNGIKIKEFTDALKSVLPKTTTNALTKKPTYYSNQGLDIFCKDSIIQPINAISEAKEDSSREASLTVLIDKIQKFIDEPATGDKKTLQAALEPIIKKHVPILRQAVSDIMLALQLEKEELNKQIELAKFQHQSDRNEYALLEGQLIQLSKESKDSNSTRRRSKSFDEKAPAIQVPASVIKSQPIAPTLFGNSAAVPPSAMHSRVLSNHTFVNNMKKMTAAAPLIPLNVLTSTISQIYNDKTVGDRRAKAINRLVEFCKTERATEADKKEAANLTYLWAVREYGMKQTLSELLLSPREQSISKEFGELLHDIVLTSAHEDSTVVQPSYTIGNSESLKALETLMKAFYKRDFSFMIKDRPDEVKKAAERNQQFKDCFTYFPNEFISAGISVQNENEKSPDKTICDAIVRVFRAAGSIYKMNTSHATNTTLNKSMVNTSILNESTSSVQNRL